MGDFRKKIKSLIHRYYSWLTLISIENKDEYELDYAQSDVISDQVNSLHPDRKFHLPQPTIGRSFSRQFMDNQSILIDNFENYRTF